MPLPTLAPWQRADSADDMTSRVSTPPTSSDRKPAPSQSSRTSRRSGRSNSQTHEITTGQTSSTSVFRDSHDSPRKPLSDEPHSLPISVHGMHTACTDKQGAIPTLYICLEESVFETVRRIDDIAEVAQLVISLYSTHHTSVLGARTSESRRRGGV